MLSLLERVMKALADKNRLRIVKMLQERLMCVCEIQAVLGLAQPTVSKHLKILKDAGIVEDIPDKLWNNYQLSAQNQYAAFFIKSARGWLNEDVRIKKDLLAAHKADREKLCTVKARR